MDQALCINKNLDEKYKSQFGESVLSLLELNLSLVMDPTKPCRNMSFPFEGKADGGIVE